MSKPLGLDLGLDDDELASCVQCGLCLPHCPTFRVTGEEAESPRGRIALMRAVQWDDQPVDAGFISHIDACVACRGCETACPSGVPFGRLIEGTRAALATDRRAVPRWQRLGYRTLAHHRLLLAGSTAVALAQRLGLVPKRLGLPARLPIRRPKLRPSGTDVWLFTGCVMDAWQREIHVAAKRLIEAAGAGVALARDGCCGALHIHAGLAADGHRLAERVIASMPGDAPILVDSAGCGAALKEHSDRVLDIHEWLAAHIDQLPPARRPHELVAVQDPCHLRHVQRVHEQVRTVLRPYVSQLVELDDDGLCCGAGGAYSTFHPDLAGEIRERKLAAIARSGAKVVASANPGCMLHLAAAGVTVRHPVELIDQAVRP